MSRESFIFLVGFIIFFTPFLGVPGEWKEWLSIVAGALIMFLGYKLRRAAFLRSIMHESGEHRSEAFVEQVHTHTEVPSAEQTSQLHI
jgi:uncharacterized membrane protein